jgi:flavin-binding protein dodecin
VHEVVGTSHTGIGDAIQTTVGALSDGKVDPYQVMLKLGFGLTDG